jgi:peptidoglycan/xylan/chitin deacetylase (PgdA/CDA1 family)
LVLHGVSATPQGEDGAAPEHDRALFEGQLKAVSRLFAVVPASGLIEAAAKRGPGERFPLAITFDDDLASHLEVAAPLLTAAGLPAAFFLTGRSLERPHRFWWERLAAAGDAGLLDDAEVRRSLFGEAAPASGDPAAALAAARALDEAGRAGLHERLGELLGPDPEGDGLTADQVRSLAMGFEIGFHTYDHPDLTTLDDAGLERAMTFGRDRLEGVTGSPLRMVAYPYGRADERVAAAAREAGYAAGFTGSPAPATAGGDPMLIGRLVPSFRSPAHLALQLAVTIARAAR